MEDRSAGSGNAMTANLSCSFCCQKFKSQLELDLHTKLHQLLLKSGQYTAKSLPKKEQLSKVKATTQSTHIKLKSEYTQPQLVAVVDRKTKSPNLKRKHDPTQILSDTELSKLKFRNELLKLKLKAEGSKLERNQVKSKPKPGHFSYQVGGLKKCVSVIKLNCNRCNRSYLRQLDLEEHSMTHELLPKRFRLDSPLKVYIKPFVQNTNSEGINLNCYLCQKSFKQQHNLNLHLSSHMNPVVKLTNVLKLSSEDIYRRIVSADHLLQSGHICTTVATNAHEKSPSCVDQVPVTNKEDITKKIDLLEADPRLDNSMHAKESDVSNSVTKNSSLSSNLITSEVKLDNLIAGSTETDDSTTADQSTATSLMNMPKSQDSKSDVQKLSFSIYKCLYCLRNFRTESLMLEHSAICIHASSKYRCRECSQPFIKEISLANHVKLVHGSDFPYRCDTCGTNFRSNAGYVSHCKTVHTARRRAAYSRRRKPNFTCCICEERFSSQSGLRVHLKLHSVQMVNCPACKREFQEKPTLLAHLQICTELHDLVKLQSEKSDITTEKLKCPGCDFKVFNISLYMDHLKSCFKLYAHTTSMIKKTVKEGNTVQSSAQFHYVEKTFKCYICNEMFAEEEISRHLRESHADDQRITCSDNAQERNKTVCNGAESSASERSKDIDNDTASLMQHVLQRDPLSRCRDKTLDLNQQTEPASDTLSTLSKDVMDIVCEISQSQCTFTCDLCNRKFTCDSELQLHLVEHSQNDSLHQTDKNSTESEQSRMSMLTELTISENCVQLPCTVCFKVFDNPTDLEFHLISHGDVDLLIDENLDADLSGTIANHRPGEVICIEPRDDSALEQPIATSVASNVATVAPMRRVVTSENLPLPSSNVFSDQLMSTQVEPTNLPTGSNSVSVSNPEPNAETPHFTPTDTVPINILPIVNIMQGVNIIPSYINPSSSESGGSDMMNVFQRTHVTETNTCSTGMLQQPTSQSLIDYMGNCVTNQLSTGAQTSNESGLFKHKSSFSAFSRMHTRPVSSSNSVTSPFSANSEVTSASQPNNGSITMQSPFSGSKSTTYFSDQINSTFGRNDRSLNSGANNSIAPFSVGAVNAGTSHCSVNNSMTSTAGATGVTSAFRTSNAITSTTSGSKTVTPVFGSNNPMALPFDGNNIVPPFGFSSPIAPPLGINNTLLPPCRVNTTVLSPFGVNNNITSHGVSRSVPSPFRVSTTMVSPFGVNSTISSPVCTGNSVMSYSGSETVSSPFGVSNTNISPFGAYNTVWPPFCTVTSYGISKTVTPSFSVSNTMMPPFGQHVLLNTGSSPFGAYNAGSLPFCTYDTGSSPFGVDNTVASPSIVSNTVTSSFNINNAMTSPLSGCNTAVASPFNVDNTMTSSFNVTTAPSSSADVTNAVKSTLSSFSIKASGMATSSDSNQRAKLSFSGSMVSGKQIVMSRKRDPFTCKFCHLPCNNINDLANHAKYLHNHILPSCQMCKKIFTGRRSLSDHTRNRVCR